MIYVKLGEFRTGHEYLDLRADLCPVQIRGLITRVIRFFVAQLCIAFARSEDSVVDKEVLGNREGLMNREWIAIDSVKDCERSKTRDKIRRGLEGPESKGHRMKNP